MFLLLYKILLLLGFDYSLIDVAVSALSSGTRFTHNIINLLFVSITNVVAHLMKVRSNIGTTILAIIATIAMLVLSCVSYFMLFHWTLYPDTISGYHNKNHVFVD